MKLYDISYYYKGINVTVYEVEEKPKTLVCGRRVFRKSDLDKILNYSGVSILTTDENLIPKYKKTIFEHLKKRQEEKIEYHKKELEKIEIMIQNFLKENQNESKSL